MAVIDGVTNPETISKTKLIALLEKHNPSMTEVIGHEFPEDFDLKFVGEEEDVERMSVYKHDNEAGDTLTISMAGDDSEDDFGIGVDVALDGGTFGFGAL